MTQAEKTANLETVQEAKDAARRAFDSVATDPSLDHRLIAIARTELDKAFAMAAHVFHVAPVTED